MKSSNNRLIRAFCARLLGVHAGIFEFIFQTFDLRRVAGHTSPSHKNMPTAAGARGAQLNKFGRTMQASFFVLCSSYASTCTL